MHFKVSSREFESIKNNINDGKQWTMLRRDSPMTRKQLSALPVTACITTTEKDTRLWARITAWAKAEDGTHGPKVVCFMEGDNVVG